MIFIVYCLLFIIFGCFVCRGFEEKKEKEEKNEEVSVVVGIPARLNFDYFVAFFIFGNVE